jgi:transcriptional regulator
MHPNPIFHSKTHDKDLAIVRARSFGTLCVNGDQVPELAHIPFILSDDGQTIRFHLVRSNPIARLMKAPVMARLSVMGPHSYISPDWYEVEDQVPTWNYVAARITGQARLLPDEALLPLLEALSDQFEAMLAPKPIWKTAKMPEDVLARLMRMIVPCEMDVSEVEATWKLGQNKPEAARLAAAEKAEAALIGQEVTELAALMREPPEL